MKIVFYDKTKFFQKSDFYKKERCNVLVNAILHHRVEKENGIMERNNKHCC